MTVSADTVPLGTAVGFGHLALGHLLRMLRMTWEGSNPVVPFGSESPTQATVKTSQHVDPTLVGHGSTVIFLRC